MEDFETVFVHHHNLLTKELSAYPIYRKLSQVSEIIVRLTESKSLPLCEVFSHYRLHSTELQSFYSCVSSSVLPIHPLERDFHLRPETKSSNFLSSCNFSLFLTHSSKLIQYGTFAIKAINEVGFRLIRTTHPSRISLPLGADGIQVHCNLVLFPSLTRG